MATLAVLESKARLAQSVERQPFKLVVVGSSPTVGVFSFACWFIYVGVRWLIRWIVARGISGRMSVPSRISPCGLMDKASPS